jgi:hypothetical protein
MLKWPTNLTILLIEGPAWIASRRQPGAVEFMWPTGRKSNQQISSELLFR